MKAFHNLKISVKFIGCFAVILLIMMAGNAKALTNANDMSRNMMELYENDLKTIKDVGTLAASFHRINTSVGSYLLLTDADSRKQNKELITANRKSIDDLMAQIETRTLSEEEARELSLFKALWSNHTKTIDKFFGYADQNQNDIARSVYDKEMLIKVSGAERIFASFIEMNQSKADSRYTSSVEMNQEIKQSTLLIMIVSLIISGLLGTLMTVSILTPVRRILSAFKSVESGDLSRPLVIDRKDELGLLGAGFETMRRSIAAIVVQTQQAVELLTSISLDIQGHARTTGDASQEIHTGLTEAAELSGRQAAQVTEDAVVIKEMSIGLKQAATSIDDISSLSGDMEAASSKGRTVVSDAVATMSSIREKFQNISTIIRDLGDHTAEIDGVMATIKQIAQETNLLALNASIEASRAGDAGRGFAVVATEVRKLSENSKASADRVGLVVERIQESTRGLLQSSRLWSEEMNEGQTKVDNISTSFRLIHEWIENINERVQDITAVIEEMAAGSEQIDGSIKRIETYSQNVTQVNRQYSQRSAQQVQAMDQTQSSLEELQRIAQELNGLVNRFVTA
ncbi:methyl-accepting chemotaxis protein [Gorillibacterium sp. sgz5001074]|uniref:methyl-accepting chemotaxis protein n=1 Tax=Gorillibacterium sp. sgz5001074 TaxID=3446695 RepID=UPI003F67B052